MRTEVRLPAMASERDDSWRDRADCRDTDPNLFFPVGWTGPAAAEIEAAKAVCAGCPVRDACLEWALETGQAHGVWGGMDERELIRLRARRKQQAGEAVRGRPRNRETADA